ncbi:MAG: MarR family winged helix-turn-helix transcriptional regulator [Candidatus Dormibacteria bacterium]
MAAALTVQAPPPQTLAPPAQAELVELLLGIVPRLASSMNAVVRQQKLSVPLTMGQFRTLRHLAAGYHTPADLATHLSVTAPTITRLVDGLERRGLVVRGSLASDRRQVRLELTDAGRAVLREFQRKAGRRIQALVDQLTPAEQRLLQRSLSNLERALVGSELGGSSR